MSGSVRNPVPAVLLGLGKNGLGVVRALRPHGVECLVVTGPERDSALATRMCSRTARANSWDSDDVVGALLDLAKELPGPAPLIPVSDTGVMVVSERREDLSDAYILSLPSTEAVATLMSKAEFQARAEELGWPVPATWSLSSRSELEAVLAAIPLPCILKPHLKSPRFQENAPQKAFRVASRQDLVVLYDQVAQWEPRVVVQEWIGGGDERIAYCLGYAPADGGPPHFFAGRKIRQWPPECGGTALAEPAPESWRGPIIDLTRRIWEEFGYRGLGSVEYKMRTGDDSPVIMEPTVGRTNYQNEIAVLNGVNLPLICYRDLMGLASEPPAAVPVTSPVKLVDGLNELRSASRYLRRGDLTVRQWWSDRRGKKRYMLFRISDPGPFVAECAWVLRALFRKGFRALGARLRSLVPSSPV